MLRYVMLRYAGLRSSVIHNHSVTRYLYSLVPAYLCAVNPQMSGCSQQNSVATATSLG